MNRNGQSNHGEMPNPAFVQDPRVTTDLAIELARQGDPVIIATLMNRLLETEGITATAQKQGNCLQVALTGISVPDRSTMVRFTQNGLQKLQPDSITTVLVTGWKAGSSQPAWSQQFPLKSHQDNTTDQSPPEAQTTSTAEPLSTTTFEALALPSETPQPPTTPAAKSSLPFKEIPDLSWLGYLLAIAVTIGFTGSMIGYLVSQLGGPPSSQPGSLSSQATQPGGGTSQNLKVIGFNWQIRYANPNLIGQLANTSDRQYSYVKIEFTLYDEAGKSVGEAMAIVTQVAPQSQREFEAPIVESRAKKATVKSITAF